MRNKRASAIIFSLLFCGLVFAATPYASITYAEGNSFILVREGKTVTWSVSSNDVFGMEIIPGDIIQTGSSTFLELSINPISASLKIAENTSFRLDADAEGTKSTGELYYGRVRAKVAKLSGSSSYRISSPSLVAGVRGTDFGVDVIAVRPIQGSTENITAASPIMHRVFCFEGSVLVAEAIGTTMNTVLIAKDEMVEKIVTSEKDSVPADEQVLKKKELSADVNTFWKEKPFSEVSLQASAVKRMEGGNLVTERSLPQGRETEVSLRNKRIPNTAAIILVGLGSVSCIGAGVYSGQVKGDSPFIAPLQSAGIVMISSGIVLALISAFVK